MRADQYLLSSVSKVDEISMLKSRKLKLFARDILHLQNNIKELILQKAVNMEMVGESVFSTRPFSLMAS